MTASELYRAEGLPVLQNRTYGSAREARACVCGDIVLIQDERSGLVRNRAFDPSLLRYDADYQNEQAGSPVFRAHLAQVAAIVDRFAAGRPLVEIGCGKGVFLGMLRARGHRVTGVDPAFEGEDPAVIRAPFSPALGVRGGLVILRHVLEHIADPAGFLRAIADANGGGTILIEVPCLDWILARRAWFDIHYEHVNYFRIHDFRRMFGEIHDSGHLLDGQYLYVVAELSSLREPVADPSDRLAFPADFTDSADRFAARCRDERAHGRTVAVWGASSKGVVFLVQLERRGVSPDLVVDINPAKQERFLPVTGLPVAAPDTARRRLAPGALVLVMNGAYLREIDAMTGHLYQCRTIDA